MKFNSIAVSTMFYKLVFRKRPYSDEIVCLRLLVSDQPKVTQKTAIVAYDFDQVLVENYVVQAHVERIRKQNNFAITQECE
jgi:DNA-binding response OmpR family regulator